MWCFRVDLQDFPNWLTDSVSRRFLVLRHATAPEPLAVPVLRSAPTPI